VTDNAVVQCIKEIRKVLCDDPHEPRFIRTVHKIGYRFIADVVEEPLAAKAGHSSPAIEGNGTPLAGTPAGPESIAAESATTGTTGHTAVATGGHWRLKRWLRWIVLG